MAGKYVSLEPVGRAAVMLLSLKRSLAASALKFVVSCERMVPAQLCLPSAGTLI